MIIRADNPAARYLTVKVDGVDVTAKCLECDPKAATARLVRVGANNRIEVYLAREPAPDGLGMVEAMRPVTVDMVGAVVTIDPDAPALAKEYFQRYSTEDEPPADPTPPAPGATRARGRAVAMDEALAMVDVVGPGPATDVGTHEDTE